MPVTSDAVETFLKWNWGGVTIQQVLWLIALFLACLVGMKLILSVLRRALKRVHVEVTIAGFIRSAARALLWLIVVIIMLGFMGVPMTSVIALLSVVGLAVSLAVQDTLGNLAGGIMILVTKPFKVGDYVETGGAGGTVTGIGLAYTRLITADRKVVFVPNREVSSGKVINYSAEPIRRVELTLSVSSAIAPEQVRRVVLEAIGSRPDTFATPAPQVLILGFKEGAVEYAVRTHCAGQDFWQVYHGVLEQLKSVFEQEGIPLTGGITRLILDREGV